MNSLKKKRYKDGSESLLLGSKNKHFVRYCFVIIHQLVERGEASFLVFSWNSDAGPFRISGQCISHYRALPLCSLSYHGSHSSR